MLGVVLRGGFTVQHSQLQGNDSQALGFDPPDHLADQSTAYAVGLDQDEAAFGIRHGRGAYPPPFDGFIGGEPSSSWRIRMR